jgi:hypothetical protein
MGRWPAGWPQAGTGLRRGHPGPAPVVLPGELRSSGPLGACPAGRYRWPLPPGAADYAQFCAALRLPRQQHRQAAGRVGAVGAAAAGRRPCQPRRPAHLETTQSPSADRLHGRGRAADQLPHRPRLPRRREDLGRRHRRAQRVRRRLQRRVHQLRHCRPRREHGVRLRPVARPDASVVQPALPGHRPPRPGHGAGSRGLDVRDHLRTQCAHTHAHLGYQALVSALNRLPTRPSTLGCSGTPGPSGTYEIFFSYPEGPPALVSILIGCHQLSAMATCRPPARAASCRSSSSY